MGSLPAPADLEWLDSVYCSAQGLVRRLAQLRHDFIAELPHRLFHCCLVFVDVYGANKKAIIGGIIEGVQGFFVSLFEYDGGVRIPGVGVWRVIVESVGENGASCLYCVENGFEGVPYAVKTHFFIR